jgi:hypothetical protein
MKEEQISMLMQSTVRNVGVSSTLRERAQSVMPNNMVTRHRRVKWPYALATSFVLAAVGFLAFRPGEVRANALIRVQQAISNVKNMHVTTRVLSPGKTRVIFESYYRDRMWLGRSFSRYSGAAWAVTKDGKRYTWQNGSTVALSEPSEPGYDRDLTALDYVKGQAGIGGIFKVKTHTDDHADVNGKAAYLLVVDTLPTPGYAGQYHTEILVDKSTNLPIKVTQTDKDEFAGTSVTESTYEFNVPLDEHFFEPCNGKAKRIRDLPEERKVIRQQWSSPLAVASTKENSCEVRELDVNKEGVVTLVYSGKLDNAYEDTKHFLPTTLSDSSGAKYARLPDLLPGAITSWSTPLTKEFTYGDSITAIAVWVPLDARSPSSETTFKIDFQTRTFRQEPQDGRGPIDSTGDVASVTLRAIRTTERFPDWSIPLEMTYVQAQQSQMEEIARAYGNEESHRFLDAARLYQRLYDIGRKTTYGKMTAHIWLERAAICYDKAGLPAKARPLMRQALQEKAVDTNASYRDREQAKAELAKG